MPTPPTTSGHYSVLADTVMTLLAEGGDVPVQCDMQYHTRDPFALRMVFSIPGSPAVKWVFGRDLLIGGLSGPTGAGDVQVYPAAAGIVFELNSPGGRARLLADRTALATLARRMVAAVPLGDEDLYFDIDAEIALLAEYQSPGSTTR